MDFLRGLKAEEEFFSRNTFRSCQLRTSEPFDSREGFLGLCVDVDGLDVERETVFLAPLSYVFQSSKNARHFGGTREEGRAKEDSQPESSEEEEDREGIKEEKKSEKGQTHRGEAKRRSSGERRENGEKKGARKRRRKRICFSRVREQKERSRVLSDR
ncbi:hypothetical protein TGRUB_359410 [Toxoplasma gondii RUB]|uniref:Uncharacterized protein n=2 Tax=Toxoplasma gondii TaxID=5811 RepID=A0A086LNC6_TOXGO|nr:hypothetical protein TGRUB_359410 [Toxoplasma gondii RUB]KFH13503.1 hypothetical protein TGVAND_359410 [Toxoplasma gondii VAND]